MLGIGKNDFGFKFKIGEIVEHVGTHNIREKTAVIFSRKSRLMIIGRVLDECPGGVQRHYDCRAIINGDSPATNIVRFNEIEVKKFVESEPTVK
jgi:hypothetical protein